MKFYGYIMNSAIATQEDNKKIKNNGGGFSCSLCSCLYVFVCLVFVKPEKLEKIKKRRRQEKTPCN
jgi:hypothetical protein